MKKLLILISLITFTACSSLNEMDTIHKAERKALRESQTARKKEMGDKHKIESSKLTKRAEVERELLKTTQALTLVEYGTEKYKELSATIEKLKDFLK